MFKNEEYNNPDMLWNTGTYHKYWIYPDGIKTHNPEFDAYSGQILDLKKKNASAIICFFDILDRIVDDDFVLCCVPSHDPEQRNSGVHEVARKIFQNRDRIIDGTEYLIRMNEIEKLSTGGNRSIEVHLSSIEVPYPEYVQGRAVLLIDDVTTTHNSILACKQLLLEAGAQSVQCLAFAQTE